MPVAVPGAAASPGVSSCNFTNAPALTVMAGLVLEVLVPSVMLVAVTVRAPAVWNVTLKLFVPETRAALAGRIELLSEEVMPAVSVALVTRFQLASTALTVTLKAAPAVCADGAPVLPVALPGEAVSPGTNSCSLVNVATLTAIAGLVLAVMPVLVRSDAVTVLVPAVLSVTLKLCVPATNAALLGSAALASLEVMPTRSLVLIKFQLASTALTVTVKAAPAVRAVGVPVLPVGVPGTAVSPGTSNCSFANAPGLTVRAGLVLAVLLLSVLSVAVTVQLPTVRLVRLRVFVPATRAELAGNPALGSVEVMATVSLTLVTKFQFPSTALTVTE